MIVPSTETVKETVKINNEENVHSFENNKKAYYEVGCKIFEINKIYK